MNPMIPVVLATFVLFLFIIALVVYDFWKTRNASEKEPQPTTETVMIRESLATFNFCEHVYYSAASDNILVFPKRMDFSEVPWIIYLGEL